MIKYTRLFITFLFAATAFKASAQNGATTSSPYSKYGIGNISPQLLPQNAGMGGIATGVNSISNYSTINFVNPAANAAIRLTTIDVGALGNITTLGREGFSSQSSRNFRLNHIAFAIPVSNKSALSFGLLPYSQVGYNFTQTQANFGTGLPSDTNSVNYNYSGEGGINKAFLGYGFGIGNLSLGANVSYLFGNIKHYATTEVPNLYGTFNTRVEESSSVKGLNYDFGLQYTFRFGGDKLVLGYSGSSKSKLDIQNSTYVSHFTKNANGDDNIAIDSVVKTTGAKMKMQLPLINHFGLSYQMGQKVLIGADYSMGTWSDLSIGGTNSGLRDSKTYNIGAQITPNVNKLNNYLALMDYQVGFMYDDTYLRVNNTNVTQYAATFGVGLPLRPNITNTSFYKINISAEIGKRGSFTNNLVKENYVNIRLGFLLNDKWFQRYKFD